jgi:hypothetical protein
LFNALPAIVPMGVLAVAGAHLAGTTWHPVGDYAVSEIIIRHAFSHPPLFGAYSANRPFHHPLPLVYVVTWAPYELLGRRSSASLAATVWFNALLIGVLVLVTARRRALGVGIALLAGLTLYARASNPGNLSIPWNPFFGVVPTVVLVVAAWQTALGRRWFLPLVAALGTWCVGAHIGYAPTVLGLALVSAVGLPTALVRRNGRRGLRLLVWPLATAVGVSLLMVTPALADLALHGSKSNPALVWQWVRTTRSPTIAHHTAWQAILGDLSLRSTWATGHRPYGVFGAVAGMPVPVLLGALVLAVALAAWRRAGDELVLLATAWTGVVTTAFGILHLQSSHLVDWYLLPMHAMGLSLAAVVVWSLCRSAWQAIEPHVHLSSSTRGRAGVVGATLLSLTLALLMVPTLRADGLTRARAPAAAALIPAVERTVPKSHTILLYARFAYDSMYPSTVALDLERAGYTVRYRPRDGYLFGDQLTVIPSSHPVTRLFTQLLTDPGTGPTPGAVLLAKSPPTITLFGTEVPLAIWLLPALRGSQ